MGRIAGVKAEETRDRVLQGAASVFARKGYDGASIAEIASEAGVSSGALYSHFGSKADLFVAAVRAYGSHELERLLTGGGTTPDVGAILGTRGAALARRDPKDGALLVAAIVAADRHPDILAALVSAFGEREQGFAGLLDAGKDAGMIDRTVPSAALARFVTMLVLGSVLVAAMELPPVDDDDWAAIIGDLVRRLEPTPALPLRA